MYNKQHAAIVRNLKPPVPLTIDIADGNEGLRIVVYEDEVMRYEKLERQLIMDYLYRLQAALRSTGSEVGIEGRSRN